MALPRSMKFSKSVGFTRNELAPSWYARFTSRICSDEVSTITGRLPKLGSRRIHLKTSNPSIPGSLRSNRMRDGSGYPPRFAYVPSPTRLILLVEDREDDVFLVRRAFEKARLLNPL